MSLLGVLLTAVFAYGFMNTTPKIKWNNITVYLDHVQAGLFNTLKSGHKMSADIIEFVCSSDEMFHQM